MVIFWVLSGLIMAAIGYVYSDRLGLFNGTGGAARILLAMKYAGFVSGLAFIDGGVRLLRAQRMVGIAGLLFGALLAALFFPLPLILLIYALVAR